MTLDNPLIPSVNIGSDPVRLCCLFKSCRVCHELCGEEKAVIDLSERHGQSLGGARARAGALQLGRVRYIGF